MDDGLLRHPHLETPLGYLVLEHLARAQGGFLPAADLGRDLGVSRDDVSRELADLRRQGYPIEDHPGEGARLPTTVDVIVRSEVEADLGGVTLGRMISCHLEVGSTNDVALQAGVDGVPHGTVIVAERQTAGRGRLGHDWYSPPGTGLWFSVILRYALEPAQIWMLTLGAGLAVANAVRDTAGIPVDLKWPNDVHTGGRKLAGVLTEARSGRDRLQLAVVGIGLNVNQDPREFPGDLVNTASSLNIATGSSYRRSAVLANVLRELDAVYSDLDPGHIRALWREASTMWGNPVRVACGDTALEGIAEDLSPEGALCLRTPDGRLTTVRVGDVGNVVDSPHTREA